MCGAEVKVTARVPLPSALRAATFPPGEGMRLRCGAGCPSPYGWGGGGLGDCHGLRPRNDSGLGAAGSVLLKIIQEWVLMPTPVL